VRIFDDFMPQGTSERQFIHAFFDSHHNAGEHNHDTMDGLYCMQCLKLFDNIQYFVGHMDVVHGLKEEKRIFPVDVGRLGGEDEELFGLTPCWYPLLVQMRVDVKWGAPIFDWKCFQCDHMHVVTSDLLLLAIKAFLHFYFEIYCVYVTVRARFPALYQLCEFLKGMFKCGVPSIISLPVAVLAPLIHPSSLPYLPDDFQSVATNMVCAEVKVTKRKDGKLIGPTKHARGNRNILQPAGMAPHVHYCLQCESYLGCAPATGGGIGAHRCVKKEEESEQPVSEGVGEGEDRQRLVSLVSKIHRSLTSADFRDYDLENVKKGLKKASVKRKREEA